MGKEKETYEVWRTPKQRKKPPTRAHPVENHVEDTPASSNVKKRNQRRRKNSSLSPRGMKTTTTVGTNREKQDPSDDHLLQNLRKGRLSMNTGSRVEVLDSEVRDGLRRDISSEQQPAVEADISIQIRSPLNMQTSGIGTTGKDLAYPLTLFCFVKIL